MHQPRHLCRVKEEQAFVDMGMHSALGDFLIRKEKKKLIKLGEDARFQLCLRAGYVFCI
eukprot:c37608_g1_i1 orf=101-277(+)